ncbi:MAG: ABC transporter ATP-binding protein/permease [Myxococcales bacterium]|nr:ABC transporter ATP-binding protein/permease [Myxococcales bacterium]
MSLPLKAERDRTIIERYTNQPARLPLEVRRGLEQTFGDQPVILYAHIDLSASLQMRSDWLALSSGYVGVARATPEGSWSFLTVERSAIQEARENPGLSCNVLTLSGAPDEPPLVQVRYSHRQRGAVETIRFILDPSHPSTSEPASSADDIYADIVAKPIRNAQAMVAKNPRAILWRLLAYLHPYRWQVLIGLGAAIVITGLNLVPPWLAGYLIDKVIGPTHDGTMTVSQAEGLAWIAIFGIALSLILKAGASWIRLRFMSVLGENVARDIRTQLYEHLQTLSLSFFSRKKTGGLITRVSSDTDRLWDFLAFGVIDVSLSFVMLIGLGTVLLSLDWRLGLVMITPSPLLIWFILAHGKTMETYFLRAWRHWSRMTDVLSDTIPGIRVVKAFNRETYEKERFDQRNISVSNEFNRIHDIWTRFWPVLTLAINAMTVVIWLLAMPRLLGTSGPELSPGKFVTFLLYTGMYYGPIEVIGQMARVMNRATSSAHRIFEVLDTEPEVIDLPEPTRLQPLQGHIVFEQVIFGYDSVRPILKGLDFEIQPGEMIGLVGPSGGGKSTIANLIARFYDPTGGNIKVDGVDLRYLDQGLYRSQVGMVLQESYLFHGSILDNICYGRPEATLDDILTAAKTANAHDFICRLPYSYDTIVGERGHTLSGGERQRISIARAILHNPRVLILDEATSAVDTETERNIEEAMHRLVDGRTVLAIAHRLSTLRRANRLFVVEDGYIIERGTHTELLSNPHSTYKRLCDMQLELQRAI